MSLFGEVTGSGRGVLSSVQRGATIVTDSGVTRPGAPQSQAPDLFGAGFSGYGLPKRAKQAAQSYGRDTSGKPKPRRVTNALLREVYRAAKGDPVKAAALIRALRDR